LTDQLAGIHHTVITEALQSYIDTLDPAVLLRRTDIEKDECLWRQYIALQLLTDLETSR
jgi:hypothetical protein